MPVLHLGYQLPSLARDAIVMAGDAIIITIINAKLAQQADFFLGACSQFPSKQQQDLPVAEHLL